MSRTLDPRSQHASGRGFEPLPATGPVTPVDWTGLGEAIRAAHGRDGGLYEPTPLPIPPGAVPVVLRSRGRGVLHRGWREADGSLHGHPRCHAVPPSEALPDGAEFWFENLSEPERLCRYPWCFRAIVREMGIVPVVGHYARKLRKRRAVAA